MKTILLKTGGKLEKKILDKYTVDQCHELTDISENSLVLYATDYLDMDMERQLLTAVYEKNIQVFRGNILRNKAYVGPVYQKNSQTIFDFMKQAEKNDDSNELVIFSDYQTELVTDASTELFLEATSYVFLEQMAALKNDNYEKNSMTTVVKESLTKRTHFLDKKNNHQKLVFNEHQLFCEPNKKKELSIHRIRSNINVDNLKKKIVDAEYGMCKHTFLDLNSRFIPMVGAENYLDGGQGNDAYGRAHTFGKSLQSALLESLERNYNAFNQQKRAEIYGSYNELKEWAIHPSEFTLHTDEQYDNPSFKYREYNDDLSFNWVWGWSIKKRKYVLLPEQLVHYHDNDKKHKDSRYIYDTSNGAALGGNLEEGLLYGLFETIERDNFLVSFYNQEKLIQIDIENSDLNQISLMKNYLKDKGYMLYFFDITKELRIPAVWCLVVNQNENAVVKTYSAAGCNFNPEKAIESAYIEVVSSVPVYEEVYKAEEYQKRREVIVKDTSKLTEFEDHVLYYSHKEALQNYDYLFEETTKKTVQELYPEWYFSDKYKNKDLNDDVAAICKDVLDNYNDIFVVNLSSDDLEATGFSCVKVLVPGMQVVTFGMQNERINYQRLRKAHNKNNKQPIGYITKNPHPFP